MLNHKGPKLLSKKLLPDSNKTQGRIESEVRVGVVCGSLRKASLNQALCRALPNIAPSRLRIENLQSPGDLPHFNQDILDHGIPKSVEDLSSSITAMDGIILVSPEYNWSIPGVLKNALDWLSRLKPNPLYQKPITLYTVSPGLLGGARAHSPIRNVLTSLECRIMAKPELQIAQGATKLDVASARIVDDATREFVIQHLEKFASFVERHAHKEERRQARLHVGPA